MPKTPTDETTSIAEELAAQQPMILETLNGLYDDATLLVGRILCDQRGATAVKAVAFGEDGRALAEGRAPLARTAPQPTALPSAS